jgi:hypothetical protein
MVHVIATLWWPSLNPIGSASVFALVAALVSWSLSEWSVLRRHQTAVVIVSAVLFITFLLVSAAPVIALIPFDVFNLKYRRFPNLDDYLGNYIVMAVGLLLALKLRRMSRDAGLVLCVIFAAIITIELGAMVCWRFAD